jgi:large subunit ribosomal protein L2
MGKNLIQQRRGKGTQSFTAPSHRYLGDPIYRHLQNTETAVSAIVTDIQHSTGHSAPLATLTYEDKETSLVVAPEGIRVGDTILHGQNAELKVGNILPLRDIPEGTNIYNIESQPGDGGKFVRSSGVTARVLAKFEDHISVELPSKKKKDFSPSCLATIGIVAGGGRTEKPFYKAGRHFFLMRSRGKSYPHVRAASMNAVDHPFGGSRSSRKGRPTIAPQNAPPGRKVGMLRPRHTGRNK